MRTLLPLLTVMLALIATGPAAAQLRLPGVGDVDVPVAGPLLDPVLGEIDDLTGQVARTATRLAERRLERIDRLVRRNDGAIERDRFGEPARGGELLVMDADAAALHITVSTDEAGSIERLESVVADHIKRFAFREELTFDWKQT